MTKSFMRKLKEIPNDTETLLFFTDNAGAIGFDKLLAETFLKTERFEKISFVVKGGPIINDATLRMQPTWTFAICRTLNS